MYVRETRRESTGMSHVSNCRGREAQMNSEQNSKQVSTLQRNSKPDELSEDHQSVAVDGQAFCSNDRGRCDHRENQYLNAETQPYQGAQTHAQENADEEHRCTADGHRGFFHKTGNASTRWNRENYSKMHVTELQNLPQARLRLSFRKHFTREL